MLSRANKKTFQIDLDVTSLRVLTMTGKQTCDEDFAMKKVKIEVYLKKLLI